MTKCEKTTADWPRTRPSEGGGTRISGTYAQPWLAESMPALFGLIVLVHCAMLFAGTANIVAAAVWGAFMALLYPLLWKRALTNMFGRMLDITVEPDRVRVRQGFFYRNYDRRNPIAFRIEPHRRGFDEALREMKTGRVQKRTYRLAVEVVMQYGERRIVLAEMPLADIGNAEALLARLQDAMGGTNATAGISVAGQALRPGSYSPYSSAAHLYG
jgi:hypothetical protein